eukprot:GHVU01016293.1.p3 GENE.GHVU01016293.1~~GHVU01016293.1.p3  ORF type:complete len:108 (-),score=1.02 GHVU01016293.1:458-781(-)
MYVTQLSTFPLTHSLTPTRPELGRHDHDRAEQPPRSGTSSLQTLRLMGMDQILHSLTHTRIHTDSEQDAAFITMHTAPVHLPWIAGATLHCYCYCYVVDAALSTNPF